MIKKTLTVTLQEQDAVTKELHDILHVTKGNSEATVVLEPCLLGKMIVEKADLRDAVREVEAFYNHSPTVAPSILTNKEWEAFDEEWKSDPLLNSSQDNKDLEEAQNSVYIPVLHDTDTDES